VGQNPLLSLRTTGLEKVCSYKKRVLKESVKKIPNSDIWVIIMLATICAQFILDLVFYRDIPICLLLEPKASMDSFVTKAVLNWIHLKINKVESDVMGI
jgi:hypothetical protein